MCGRFVQAQDPEAYGRHFEAAPVENLETTGPSFNVAPTHHVLAVVDRDGERRLGRLRWGLIPRWADDPAAGSRHINARAETLAEKPTFRGSFAGRRCIIPADGFFEWERRPGGKVPHYVYRADGAPLALAGLWSSWRPKEEGERVASCAIITTEPNRLMSSIHDRMPAVLPAEAWDLWLDPGFEDLVALQSMLGPTGEDLAEHPVSTLVNSVRNNLPECIVPLEPWPG